jgi:Ala-tRNA(Pro) deacylase
MSMAARIRDYLDSNKVSYQPISHPQAFEASNVAHTLHVPEGQFAKAIVLRADGHRVMAVLPASQRLNMHELKEALGVKHLEMTPESELAKLCGECELGAFPPFGQLYGMDVWIDRNLAGSEEIIFNAGTHTDALRMKYSDYARLANPHSAKFAEVPDS